MVQSAAQGEISITHKLLGHSKTFALDELSGGVALYQAYTYLKENKLKSVIAGGVESVHFQPVYEYINHICQSNDKTYVPVDAACFIKLENDSEEDQVELSAMGMGASFEAALSFCLPLHELDYCIMPVRSGHYPSDLLSQDVNSLKRMTKKDIVFDSPQQQAGNVVSASFPLAVAFASQLIKNMRQILVVGKSYTNMYICALLKKQKKEK